MERVSVCVVRNPFDPLDSRDFFLCDPGRSIDATARHLVPALEGYDIVASMNGEIVTGAILMERVLLPGDSVVFCPVPRGGGGGKNPLAIIAMLAVMVVASAYGGPLGAGVAGQLGFSAGAASSVLGSAAIMIAGGLIVNAIFPAGQPDQLALKDSSTSPTYSWEAQGNYLYEGGALPEIYGTHRVTPPLIAKYVSTEGDKQYLNMLFAVAGHSVDSIHSVRINEQPSSYFSGVVIETRLGSYDQQPVQFFGDTFADGVVGQRLSSIHITGATKANPCVITAPAHGFLEGDVIRIENVGGMTQLNDNDYIVGATPTVDDFHLHTTAGVDVNSSGYGVFSETGTALASIWRMVRTSGTSVQGVGFGISLPRGLYYAADDGSLSAQSGYAYMETRKIGEPDWVRINTVAIEETTVSVDRWSGGYYTQISGGPNPEGGYDEPEMQWVEEEAGSTSPGAHVENDIYSPAVTSTTTSVDEYGNPTTITVVTRAARLWRWLAGTNVVFATGDVIGPYALINAATTEPIHRMYHQEVPAGQYDLRVCLGVAPQETSNRYGNETYFESYQEILYDDFQYPGVALLAVRAVATDQLSGGLPKIDCMVTRGTVQVWDPTGTPAYDSETATNPAWVCYDLLHRGGGSVPANRIDYAKFKEWADYCASLVASSEGEVPKHTCNIYFDQVSSLRSQLNKVSLLGRGTVVQLGSKFTVMVDKPDAVTQKFTFGMGNILADSYHEEFIPLDDRANSVEVTFFDHEREYMRSTVEVFAEDFDTTLVETNKASLSLYGCVNKDEANRHGQFALNNNRFITTMASWEADVDAIACIPGDLVEVSHDVPRYGISGRVVSSLADSVTLDQPVVIAGGTTYQVMVRHQNTDVTETKTVVSTAGTYTELHISGTWTNNPVKYANYAFGPAGMVSKTFRVLKISRSQDMRRKITGIEYYPAIYMTADIIEIPDWGTAIGTVSSLRARESYQAGDKTNVNLRWTGTGLKYRVWQDDGSGRGYKDLGTAYGTSFTVRGLSYPQTLRFHVSATSAPSDGKVVSIALVGRSTPPGEIDGLIAVPENQYIALRWTAVTGFDLDHYEIRLGNQSSTVADWPNMGYLFNWGEGNVPTTTKTNSYKYRPNLGAEGTFYLYVRAVDHMGNLSEQMGAVTFTVVRPGPPQLSTQNNGDGTFTLYFSQPSSPWVQGTFPLWFYAYQHGAAYNMSSTNSRNTSATSVVVPIDWKIADEPTRIYWAIAEDMNYIMSFESSVGVTITPPGSVQNFSVQTLEALALLSWSAPTTGAWKLPVACYEIRKGDVFASATVIATQAGTFLPWAENYAGAFTYWVVPVDTAGNYGTERSLSATVSGPANFTFLESWLSTFGGTISSGLLQDGKVLLPVDTTETYEQHFTHQSATTWQGMIDAGFDDFLEDVPNTGTYVETFDYGTTISSQTSIRVEKLTTTVFGTPSISCKISVSLDNSAWTDHDAVWQVYESDFRYVKVTITVTASGGNDLLTLDTLQCVLDLQTKTDSGTASAVSTDGSGTVVTFNKSFYNVTSITLTPASGSTAYIATYTYVDASDHFHLYLFNTSGTRVSGTVSWIAKGV